MSRKRAKRVLRHGSTRSAGPIDRYFGDRLRARRLMMKISQEEMGEKLGISVQQLQKYEKGTNRLRAAMIVSVVDILDVHIGYFYDEVSKTKGRKGEIETGPLTEVVLTSHGRRMINAFLNLKNEALRGAVADLAQVLAR